MASVPIIVLLYNGLLLGGFNVSIKELTMSSLAFAVELTLSGEVTVFDRFFRAIRCISAAYAVMRCVCVSVCPSRSCVASKRKKDIFKIFFTIG